MFNYFGTAIASLKDAMHYYSYTTTTKALIAEVDDNGSLTVRYELPGVDKKDLKIGFTNQKIFLEYKNDRDQEDSDTITISDKYDTSKTDAVLENGVLKLTIPKKTADSKNTIKVR